MGARKVAVFSVGRIGCIPYELARYNNRNYDGNGDRCNEEINEAISIFNAGLVRMVTEFNAALHGAKFVYVNTYDSLKDLTTNAVSYGNFLPHTLFLSFFLVSKNPFELRYESNRVQRDQPRVLRRWAEQRANNVPAAPKSVRRSIEVLVLGCIPPHRSWKSYLCHESIQFDFDRRRVSDEPTTTRSSVRNRRQNYTRVSRARF